MRLRRLTRDLYLMPHREDVVGKQFEYMIVRATPMTAFKVLLPGIEPRIFLSKGKLVNPLAINISHELMTS